MINLRYHIVSITAVFLALAIGLALGSTLIQRGLVDTLEGRLDELGERLDRTDGENRELRDVIRSRDEFDDQFADDARVLFGGHLADTPVLMVAAQGTDDELVADTRESLRTAGAELSGLLLFTSRWDELSEGEIEELSGIVGRSLSNEQIARTTVLRRLASEVVTATDDPPAPEPEPDPEPGDDPGDGGPAPSDETPALSDPGAEAEVEAPDAPDPDTPDPGDGASEGDESPPADDIEAPPPVPDSEIIPALLETGYLEFRPEGSATPLPSYGLRLVVLDDVRSSLDPDRALLPLLDAMTMLRSDTLPIVVAGLTTELEAGEDEEVILEPSPLVAVTRTEERLAGALSSVDDARSFAGQAGLIMALSEHGSAGHYGITDEAQSLLPPRVP